MNWKNEESDNEVDSYENDSYGSSRSKLDRVLSVLLRIFGVATMVSVIVFLFVTLGFIVRIYYMINPMMSDVLIYSKNITNNINLIRTDIDTGTQSFDLVITIVEKIGEDIGKIARRIG